MALLLILLFIVMPIVEIYVIIQVGQAIGPLWTILLLIADAVIGARLLSWQGRQAWRRFQEALAVGRMPHNEILDGVMVIFGGALLLTPGFITDIFGLIFLLPPTRSVLRRFFLRSLGRRGTIARVVIRSVPMRREPPPSPTATRSQGTPPPPRELPPG
jgi:UPF0716 protein FxsA